MKCLGLLATSALLQDQVVLLIGQLLKWHQMAVCIDDVLYVLHTVRQGLLRRTCTQNVTGPRIDASEPSSDPGVVVIIIKTINPLPDRRRTIRNATNKLSVPLPELARRPKFLDLERRVLLAI